ncbi:hypothetical protein PT974_07430 [Cladobotryum mycophilum]|uniref:SSCRP protein n=1 Tax=Cladobotryum mycophilum TaxID=491253 RepID=A0ABR0SQE4_9HYPO
MKAVLVASALLGLSSAATIVKAGVHYEEWFTEDCAGKPFSWFDLIDGSCSAIEQFPVKSIKLTPTNPCPAGTSFQVRISTQDSSTGCDDKNPAGIYVASGSCINVSYWPATFQAKCI